MTNEFEGYLTVISLIVELEHKFKVFWNGGVWGFIKQASKVIKNNFKKCVHVVIYILICAVYSNIHYSPLCIAGQLSCILRLECKYIITVTLDWRQCGNSLALCYFAVVMELLDSLWMNCKSEFGVIFLRCSPT